MKLLFMCDVLFVTFLSTIKVNQRLIYNTGVFFLIVSKACAKCLNLGEGMKYQHLKIKKKLDSIWINESFIWNFRMKV